jgi:hypothetical protein
MKTAVRPLLFAALLAAACAAPVRAADSGQAEWEAQTQRALDRAAEAQQRAEERAEAEQERQQAEQERREAAQERRMARIESDIERRAQRAADRAEEQVRRAQQQAADAVRDHDYSALTALNDLPLAAVSPDLFAQKHGRTSADSPDSGGGAERPVNERRALNADGRVFVNDVAGTVVVTGWNRNEVVASGTLGYGVDHLEVSGDDSSLSFVVKLPKHGHNVGETQLRLMVPYGANVELETVSADVSVQGTRGPLKISTVSGDVGADVQSPQVAVQTVSGDLILRAPSKQTQANTVSGDLHLSGLEGELTVESVSGNLSVSGSRFSELRLKSISGDMGLDASFAPTARVTGETLSGNITLHVPADVSGTALVKSFSGESQCDLQQASTSAVNKGKKREYVFGDGHGVNLELSTFSGDVHIDRLQGRAPPTPPAPPAPPR